MKIAHSQILRAHIAANRPLATPPSPSSQVDTLVLGAINPPPRPAPNPALEPWPLPTRIGIFTGFAGGVAVGLAAPHLAHAVAKGTITSYLGGLAGTAGLLLLTHSTVDQKTDDLVVAGLNAGTGLSGGILVGLPVGMAARALLGL